MDKLCSQLWKKQKFTPYNLEHLLEFMVGSVIPSDVGIQGCPEERSCLNAKYLRWYYLLTEHELGSWNFYHDGGIEKNKNGAIKA